MDDCKTVCSNEGLCLMQQQLFAQSLLAFGNMVSMSKSQDLEYLKSTQLITVGSISGKQTQISVPAA